MNYQEAIEYIIDRDGYEKGFVANPFLEDNEIALGLKRTEGLLEHLGRPDRQYRIAHVAGTKGKGSTSAMIAAIARAGGRSVGVYATPHLHSFRERIMLDDAPVSEEVFARAAEKVAVANQQLVVDEPEIGPPTAFEIVTAMALLIFAETGVDLAVVEVGLGGRLDSTNVVDPAVAVITSISLDHVSILGDTLDEIAAEKGGIIKPGKPVVIGPQTPEALGVLQAIAAERRAPLTMVGRDWKTSSDAGRARLTGPWGDWENVDIALAGPHQIENAGLALMASWVLHPDIAGDEKVVREALGTVRWPGRFELVGKQPDIYVDGAHNVDSIVRLVETLRGIAAGRPMAVIFGAARDKDLSGMLRELVPLNAPVLATASHNPRATDPETIVTASAQAGITAHVVADIGDAIAEARALVGAGGLVCVTGSLYVVAEAREALGLAETPAFERTLLYR